MWSKNLKLKYKFRVIHYTTLPPSCQVKHSVQNLSHYSKKKPVKKVRFIFEKDLDFLSLLWYVVVLTEMEISYRKRKPKQLSRNEGAYGIYGASSR